MATVETTKGESLEVRKTIAAPREKVFRAWTEPEAVKQWFPPPGYEAAPTDIDLRPGGSYRWGLRKLPDGKPFWSTGTFIEVVAPRRIVYTWLWSGLPEENATRVTIDFHDRGGQTEVVLRHDRFVDVNQRNQHEQGWKLCIDQLNDYMKKEEKKS